MNTFVLLLFLIHGDSISVTHGNALYESKAECIREFHKVPKPQVGLLVGSCVEIDVVEGFVPYKAP